ncbi:MAG TPA: prepilin-type N-terminal cleavage/methylation domain-containing protein [Longimicrobiales bacterium]
MRVLPRREGFTLIELMIVIVIIGILAMIAVSLFWNVKDRGLGASMQSDLKTAATQQELYFSAHSTYASSAAALTDFHPSPGVVLTINYGQADGWAGITTHVSLPPGVQCGLAVNGALLSDAPPATTHGVVACTGL